MAFGVMLGIKKNWKKEKISIIFLYILFILKKIIWIKLYKMVFIINNNLYIYV